MLQGEHSVIHSAILWAFIKLPFTIKIFICSFFKWPLKAGFTVFLLRIRVIDFVSPTCRLLRKYKHFLLLGYVTSKWSYFGFIMEKAELS